MIASTQGANRASRSDRLILTLVAALAIIGAVFCYQYRDTVFPSASIQFDKGKEEVLVQAEKKSRELGYEKSGVIKSIYFSLDDDSKTFLEYEMGAKEANRIMSTTVPVFYWICSFRKAYDQETMTVYMNPSGKFLGFDLQLPNDKKMPSITIEEARKKALSTVTAQTGWPESDWKLISEETNPRLHRTDHSFTWEYTKLEFKKAHLRVSVGLAGDKLSDYWMYLKVPESWQRHYQTVRSYNELLGNISYAFIMLVYPIAVFLCLTGIQSKNLRSKFANKTALILGAIALADGLNELPYNLCFYSPESSYMAFVFRVIISTIVTKTAIVIMVAFFLTGAGELVYRRAYPEKVALEKVFTTKALAFREIKIGLILGSLWSVASLGYQSAYYFIGEKVGFWCPLGVSNYQVLSSYLPWIGAVSLGTFASTNEEIISRVITLTLAQRFLRNFWLANLVQAVIWGFAHSSYPQQPCFARGLELTLEGLVDGWIIRRFGLLPCLVSHYLFDAFCGVEPLFKAPASLQATAVLPMIPVVVLIIFSLILAKKKKQERGATTETVSSAEDADLLNESIPITRLTTPESAKAEIESLQYEPLARRSRAGILVLAVIGLIGLNFVKAEDWVIGRLKSHTIVTRQKAIKQAERYLQDEKIDLTGYLTSTSLDSRISYDTNEYEYLKEKVGFKKTKEMVEKCRSPLMWEVKFVKPLSPNQYSAIVDADGRMMSPIIYLGEDEPGKSPTDEEAKKLATDFINKYRPEFLPVKLDHFERSAKNKRVDFVVTFTSTNLRAADAPLKVSVSLSGDKVDSVSQAWNIPDQWEWKRERKDTKDQVLGVLQMIFACVVFGYMAFFILKEFLRGQVRWKTAMYISAAVVFFDSIDDLNGMYSFFASYSTTTPLNSYYVREIVSEVVKLLLSFALQTFLVALVLSVLTDKCGQLLRGTLAMLLPPHRDSYAKPHRDFWLDALLLGAGMSLAERGLLVLFDFIKYKFGMSPIIVSNALVASTANSVFGVGNVILYQLATCFTVLVAIGLLTAACIRVGVTKFYQCIGAAFLISLILHCTMFYWQEFAIRVLLSVATAAFLWFLLARIGKRNPLAVFLYLYFHTALSQISMLLEGGFNNFAPELSTCIVIVLLPVIYLTYNQTVHAATKRLMAAKRNK